MVRFVHRAKSSDLESKSRVLRPAWATASRAKSSVQGFVRREPRIEWALEPLENRIDSGWQREECSSDWELKPLAVKSGRASARGLKLRGICVQALTSSI